MSGVATYTRPNYTTQLGASYKGNLDAAAAVFERIAAAFAPHEQSLGSPTPDLSIRVDAGYIFSTSGLTEVAAQTVSGFTIPSAGQERIDRVVIDSTTGVATRVAGTAVTGSPSATPPAIPAGKLPCCQVRLTSSDTAVLNSNITDERIGVSPPANAAAIAGTAGLKVVPLNVGQGTWVNGTTTYSAVTSGNYGLTTTTNNDGHIISDPAQFSAVNYLISQIATGVPVYVYEYWNGASWASLTVGTTPTFTAVGLTQMRFTVPGDWAVGGSGTGVPAGNFNIRVRATTAPSQAVQGRASLSNKVGLTADQVVMLDTSNVPLFAGTVSISPDIRVAGSAANGRDQAGAFTTSTFIHLWIISNGTTTAGLWSASASAPTLPSGYTYKAYAGAWYFDSNSLLRHGSQFKDEHRYTVGFKDAAAVALTTTAVSLTPTIPANATKARMLSVGNSAGQAVFFSPTFFTGANAAGFAGQSAFVVQSSNTGNAGSTADEIPVLTANTLYWACGSTQTTDAWTMGFRNPGNLN